MTYMEEPEVRRASRGTKVLGFGCAILAVLGSFWGIVWFIRTYVEPPRVMMPSPLALASRDTTPVALASPGQTKRIEAATDKAAPAAAAADPADRAAATGGIADRWAPLTQTAAAPAPAIATVAATPPAAETAPAPTMSAATALTTAPDAEAIEQVAEGSVPAITGRAPLPRRRPTMTASAAKRSTAEPPLPRPRPDGPAPQSVFTSVPVTDDRFPTQ